MTPFASLESAHSIASPRRIWWSVALHVIALLLCLGISSIPPAPASAIPSARHVTLIAPAPPLPPPVLKKTRAVPKMPLPVSEPQRSAPKPAPREFSSPVRKSQPPPRQAQIEMPAIPALEPVAPPISLAEPLPLRELPPPPIVVGKLSGAATAAAPAPASAALRASGFSTSSGPAAEAGTKALRSSSFQNAAIVTTVPSPRGASVSTPITRPVEILKKPQPVYTDEARSLRLEGDVSLEVLFTASAEIRVLRVIRGLGHGLDEAAIASTSHIQFRPALREGEPIDQTVTVHIRFQLAY